MRTFLTIFSSIFSILFFKNALFAGDRFTRFESISGGEPFIVQPEGNVFLVYANPTSLIRVPSIQSLSSDFVKICDFMNSIYVSGNQLQCKHETDECFNMRDSMRRSLGRRRTHLSYSPFLEFNPLSLDFIPLRDLSEVRIKFSDQDFQEIKSLYPNANANNVQFMPVENVVIHTDQQFIGSSIDSLSFLSQISRLLPAELIELSPGGTSLRLNGFDLQCDYTVNGLRPIVSTVELQFKQNDSRFDRGKLVKIYDGLKGKIREDSVMDDSLDSEELRLIRKGALLSQVLVSAMPAFDLSPDELSAIVSLYFDEEGFPRIYGSPRSLERAWERVRPVKSVKLGVRL